MSGLADVLSAPCLVLGFPFVVLKLIGVIAWSWLWLLTLPLLAITIGGAGLLTYSRVLKNLKTVRGPGPP
jgi:hypothetical protein